MADVVLTDDEVNPRNAGAIRTALMLGAVFEQRGGRLGEHWCIVGIEGWWYSRSLPAFLFLATHGIGIDENGSPKPFTYFMEISRDVSHQTSG